MHLTGRTYDELRANFKWVVPDCFSIPEAVASRHARATPDATALIEVQPSGPPRVWSFAAIERDASRLANALASLGVTHRTIVAVHLSQSAETLISHLAILKLGAISMPLFGLFGPDAIRFRLEDSSAPILITTGPHLERIAPGLTDLPSLRHIISVDGAGPLGAASWHTLVEQGAASHTPVDTAANDPAFLMYTSGTTGNPKGVLHAHRMLLGHLPGVCVPHDLFPHEGDRFWTPADWAWAGGLFDVLLPSLYFGIPVVSHRMPRFEPEAAFALMAAHQVRNVFMPATALRLLRQAPNPKARHAYRLRSLASGGEPLGADMLAWGEETFGFKMAEFYGQTEVNLVVGNCPSVFPPRPGSMGRPIPGHHVSIVDDAGNEVPDGEPGVVAVRRPDPVMFLEYWRQPEATAAKFRGDWCLMGDVAVRDSDGYFWFQGRDNDIIKSSGYRIGPGEVEECLGKHPAVALAGVIGTPDPLRGEAVTAFILPAKGYQPSPALEAEIQAFVKERLASHEWPRKIRFVTEMPMTVTGKIRRIDLRNLDREMG